MRPLAARIAALRGEGALSVFARARELERQGRSIIHLELGEPDFHPAAPVIEALNAAVAQGRDRYCAVQGLPALRDELALYLARTRGLDVSGDQIVIAPGCKIALFFALMALVEPGDEVLYPEPGFPGYPSITRGLGGVPVAFELAIPGAAFGPSGNDFVRFSFAASSALLGEAIERIRQVSSAWQPSADRCGQP